MSKLLFLSMGVAALLQLCACAPSLAVTYSGSLQYTPPTPPDSGDGLFVGPFGLHQWVDYTVNMSWTVTDTDNTYSGFPWKYTYTFGHNGGQAGISHVIIEGSNGISAGDITGLLGGTLSSVGSQTVQSGNPNMPEGLNGLRFDPTTQSPFSMTWTFWSNRAPVWGDFYARCGGKQGGPNFAYNYNMTGSTELGFTTSDVDPTGPASNGSLNYHILRPDSTVPEPASVFALAAGLLPLGVKLRRKK